MKKTTLALGAAMLIAGAANAQRYFGISTSNWGGSSSLYWDPSSIAGSTQKFTIDLFSLDGAIDNNLGTIKSANLFNKLYKQRDASINDIIAYDNNKSTFNMTVPYLEVRGPGFTWNIDHRNSIALTTRVRGFVQMTDVDQSLFRSIADASYSGSSVNHITAHNFDFNTSFWSEIGLSYARVLVDNGKNVLKGGITVRYLGGIAYANVQSSNLDATIDDNTNVTVAKGSTLSYNSNIATNDNSILTNGLTVNDAVKSFFGAGGNSGASGDLGFSYEFRPDYDKYKYDMDGKTNIVDYGSPRYKFKLFASITDVGAIRYRNGNEQGSLSAPNGGMLSGDTIRNNIRNFNEFQSYATRQGFVVPQTDVTTTYHLPTSFIGGIDYRFSGNFYANAMYIANIAPTHQIGNYFYNQVTVTPRYDTRVFTVGVPVTYSTLSNSLKVGLAARVAGFFIGSDDLLAVASSNQYGFNFYFGAYVPINYRKPKDSDHDHVSNKYDKCPGVVGTWEFKGCPDPDTDHDGVLDSVDKCPTVPGSPTAMGCPDKDLDSVADASDRCPDQAGPVALQGCPDRDHDGIVDIDDACPDQPGLAKFHGCPDTDGDGIPDNEDLCPTKPGPLANHGCPDTDNDGVPDNIDRCPTVPGPASNQGCPAISEQVKKRLAFAATAIQFETGKAIIKKKSYPLLDEIVKILNDYPDYYMTIDGHTDNVGKPASNIVLSHDRADAVKAYFVGKGINTSRLATNGYGETRPVASNKTAAGRAKNRRVAMDLKLKDNQ